MRKWMVLIVGCLGLSTSILAASLALKPNAPDVYTVQPGDTLMQIAFHYLQDPINSINSIR